jgi:hypothetical protein
VGCFVGLQGGPMFYFRLLLVCLLGVDTAKKPSPKLAVNNWFTHNTLGVGVHAGPQLKHAAAKSLINIRTLIREKVLVKGPNWKTKFAKQHAVTQCISVKLR